MWLDELSELIDALRTRINDHEPKLSRNEALTRTALVDPVLRNLGWDLEDPAQAIPEYSGKEGRGDYALFAGGQAQPTLIIEAKSLGTSLDNRLEQALRYANEQAAQFFVVTDGQRWSFYETFRMVPPPERLIFTLDIATDDPNRVVMNLLWLWRGNFVTGKPEMARMHPPARTDASPPDTPGEPSPQPTRSADKWVALTEVLPQLRKSSGHPPPKAIRFPDGVEYPIRTWWGLQVCTVEWLVAGRRLTLELCPVTTPRGSHIVHSKPTRADGNPFVDPRKQGAFYVDASRNAKDHARVVLAMLDALGEDSRGVSVIWKP